MRRSVGWPGMAQVALAVLTVAASIASAQTKAADSSGVRASHVAQRHPLLIAVIGGPGVETPTPYLFESDGNVYQTQKRPMVLEVELSKTLFATSGKDSYFEYFVAAQPVISVG